MKDFLGYKDKYLSTKRWYNFLRFIVPMPCMMCGEVESVEEAPLCESCYAKFKEMLSAPCPICGENKEECVCIQHKGIRKNFFLFWYSTQDVFRLVSKVKYSGDKRIISFMGSLIAQEADEKFSSVCFAPRSKRNIKRLGFDQSKLLAESVAYHLGIPFVDCIKRRKDGDEQKKLSGYERRRNVRNKFYVDREKLINEKGKIPSKVLLIDDVVTTGSTVKECSYLLRKAGVRTVSVGAVAKTPLKKKKYKRKK